MSNNRSKKSPPWNLYLVIGLVILLALLLIYSRGYKAVQKAALYPVVSQNAGLQHENADDESIIDDYFSLDMDILNQHSDFHPDRSDLLGLLNPASHPDFLELDLAVANRSSLYLRIEAHQAFINMHEAALADGISLKAISAARSFDHQKMIWENKWNGRQILHGNVVATDIASPPERSLEILRFSAMPGTSRHHWGTDIDLNSLENSYFDSGYGKAVYDWLQTNASRFGFCQPYTSHGDRRQGGYEEEKWHWSYLPLARVFQDAYAKSISYADLVGFDGHETAKELRVIEAFVLNVNKDCMERP